MERPKGNSLCSYLYLKQAKMSCFSAYLFSSFFCKIGEHEGRTGPPQVGWVDTSGRGEVLKKGSRR
jgi:hypothetical protein